MYVDLIEMELDNEFIDMIEEIIKGIGTTYSTIGHLQNIIKQLRISPHDINISRRISLIERTINGYGGYGKNDKLLTNRQINTLIKTLRKAIQKDLEIDNKLTKRNYIISPNRYYVSRGMTQSKIEHHDPIFSVIFNLLTNLSNNVMGSTLNVYIINYFEDIGPILNEAPDKYFDVTSEIQLCLQTHGWDCTGNSTIGGRGFRTEPNKINLIEDFQQIINKYF